MQVAIVGPPLSGKTTLSNLLAGNSGDQPYGKEMRPGRQDVAIRMAKVPDERIDFFSNMFKPRKTTYAQIQITDVPGLSASTNGSKADCSRFLSYLRTVDAFIYVIRAFGNVPGALPIDYEIDPISEIESLNLNLILADLQVAQNRIERLEHSRKRNADEEAELELLQRAKPLLEEGKRLDRLLTPEEKHNLRGYAFLTLKPIVIVVNLSEDQFLEHSYPGKEKLKAYLAEHDIPLIELSAKIEAEIQELPGEEQKVFLQEYGITEPAIGQLSKKVYQVLGLISFFTVGEDEVKAWPIQDGTTAKKAAGKVHSDIERGFIRAEVVSFEDLKNAGSVAAVRSGGVYRLEGKDYIVKDGDIMNFRFNI
ncbi:MAG: redox-regulated ATPase YchF [Firmicutes bacterium]|nr:redox-regulated ATPase YchF [Bacillota bacterium]